MVLFTVHTDTDDTDNDNDDDDDDDVLIFYWLIRQAERVWQFLFSSGGGRLGFQQETSLTLRIYEKK